jgi:TatD DNase family protein
VSTPRARRGADRQGEPPPLPAPLPAEVLDSHAHLDLMGVDVDAHQVEVGVDVDEALDAARSVGIGTVVQVGVDLPSSRWSVDVAGRYEQVHAAVALHPNEAGRGGATDEALREIEALAPQPQVRAVGETGLDHFRTESAEGRRLQEDSFRAHIAIAKRCDRTLVIHDRDAHDEVLRVLLDEGAPDRVVFHCFSGGTDMARTCAEHGFWMSFAGPVTFKPNDELRAAAALAPPELLLVETDAPFLTPVPYRGRPNAPYLVPLTVHALAQTTGTDLEQLCAVLAENGRRAFPPS